MKRITMFLFAFIILIGGVSDVQAWPDGQRSGLLLGATVGYSNAEFENGGSEDGDGYMAGIYLGAGLNEQFLLSFRYRYINVETDNNTFHTFAWTGDMMFFPSPQIGLFINAGFGRSLVAPDEGDEKSGTVYYAGIGYEITKWVFLSVDYSKASLEDDLKGTAITFAISVIGY